MGKTRDLFKKIRDTKGTFHAKMGLIKDRNGMDLTEAEDIKKRWQEYWSILPVFPPPGDLPDPGIKPRSLALQVGSLPSEPPGKPKMEPNWGLFSGAAWLATEPVSPMLPPSSCVIQQDSISPTSVCKQGNEGRHSQHQNTWGSFHPSKELRPWSVSKADVTEGTLKCENGLSCPRSSSL